MEHPTRGHSAQARKGAGGVREGVSGGLGVCAQAENRSPAHNGDAATVGRICGELCGSELRVEGKSV